MDELRGAKHFPTRKSWRNWLIKNHGKEKCLWLLFYKKHTGKAGLGYGAMVEEALCFGWIDGQLKSVDEERYILRLTPRRKKSVWSLPNKRRIKAMLAQGKMAKAGMESIKGMDLSEKALEREAKADRDPRLPAWMRKHIKANKKAWKT